MYSYPCLYVSIIQLSEIFQVHYIQICTFFQFYYMAIGEDTMVFSKTRGEITVSNAPIQNTLDTAHPNVEVSTLRKQVAVSVHLFC